MKLKVVVASLAVAVVAVAAFAFVPAKRTAVTYNYVSGTDYQRMLFNHNAGTAIERSIDKDQNTPPFFKRTASWTTSAVSYTPSSQLTDYIGSISFDEEATADGGSDGQLTLQEAINALYSNFISTQAMPASLVVDGSASISVTPATAAH